MARAWRIARKFCEPRDISAFVTDAVVVHITLLHPFDSSTAIRLAQYVRPIPPKPCKNTLELSFSARECASSSIGVSGESKWSVHVRLLGVISNFAVMGGSVVQAIHASVPLSLNILVSSGYC